MKFAVALTALVTALPFVAAYSNPVLYEDLVRFACIDKSESALN